jgi:hypothetical protein
VIILQEYKSQLQSYPTARVSTWKKEEATERVAASGAQVEDAPARTTLQISNAPLANVIAFALSLWPQLTLILSLKAEILRRFLTHFALGPLHAACKMQTPSLHESCTASLPFYLFVRCLLIISKTGVCRRSHAEFVSSLSAEDVELCKKPL